MNSTSKPINETAFSSQLADFVGLLKTFSDLLDQEADAIKKNDADGLSKTSLEKQDYADKLNRAGNEIEQTLKPFSDNLVDFSLTKQFSQLPNEQQNQVKAAINMTIECHDKNLANGMSIQMLSNINKQALDILSGKQNQDVKLYGSSGEKSQSTEKNTLGKA